MGTFSLAGRVLTPAGFVDDGLVHVANGQVAWVGRRQDAPATGGAPVYGEAGDVVAPGFIDLHVHGGGGHDFMDGTEAAHRVILATHVRFGSTGLLATTLTATQPDLLRAIGAARQVMANPGGGAARLLGIHLEGPWLNPKMKGAQRGDLMRDATLEEIDALAAAAGPLLKLVSLAPERDGALDAVARLHAAGVLVSAAHTDATYDEVLAAVSCGLGHITHTGNGMRGFHHREPGVLGAALALDSLSAELIADGIHLHPGALRAVANAKPADKLCLITDAMAATGQPEGTYSLGGLRVTVRDGACRLDDGTLAGSVLTMDRAVRVMVEHAGLPLERALVAASTNPARAAGLAQHKGSVAPGYDADLVLLDADLRVRMTVVAGQVAYSV